MKTLSQMSGMPQMRAAFSGWMKSVTLVAITQSVVDGFVQTKEENITFTGTIQPLSPQQIMLKPDGQRSWQWLQIHCLAGPLNLATNDLILYNCVKYKVMGIYDYSLNNFIEYHVVRDYESAS